MEMKRLFERVPVIWSLASERVDNEKLGPKREEGMEPKKPI